MIKVIFRVHNVKGEEPEVIAFFPELAGTNAYLQDCLSYVHVGQHGSASLNYYYESTRPATPDEYRSLLDELQGIYEGQLKPASRMTRADQESRKAQVYHATWYMTP
jgi:hypothetical protein